MTVSFQTPAPDSLAVPPDWPVLYEEARALARREPLLAPSLSLYFPDGGDLALALGARLAETLQTPCIGTERLRLLFVEEFRRDAGLVTAAQEDLYAIRSRDPACDTYLHAFLNLKGFQAVQAYRVAHALWSAERTELALWLSNRVSVAIGVDIHPAARIGLGVMFDHATGVVIGETAVVEDHVSILQNVTLGGTGKHGGDRHPKVRRGVMIGAGAKVVGNIQIGANAKVAAGSVVLKDVPPNCTVAGIPAQIVRIHDASQAPAESMDQSL
ncbi:serine O-acetyltransferase [Pacificoceanicola onchidii]|uniref:serine O-acetyltransferase n=1 Tax=Pacificoceanicola onchidii TaxID=2562685 RepID=UPI0010A6214A|nr:serine O-acetyltransferase [Pacificoceanicola onchidii]